MFNFQIQPTERTSTCVEKILVNPVQGTVTLRYRKNGYEYKYSNVSRAKILNLLINDNMSLGFWVQELINNSVRVRDYIDGNTVATGKPCYQFLGATYSTTAALPF
tara:strand:+ start:355 stop:672 length:318 start_codon:yes stop_codon:yes gene_type:complete